MTRKKRWTLAVHSVNTCNRPHDVIGEPRSYFREGGLGLSLLREGACCVVFEGGAGRVSMTVSQEDERSEVELETREWDYAVKEFIGQF